MSYEKMIHPSRKTDVSNCGCGIAKCARDYSLNVIMFWIFTANNGCDRNVILLFFIRDLTSTRANTLVQFWVYSDETKTVRIPGR